MPRKEEELRELTPEEKLVCLPIDFFGQVLEVGNYISYPVYRKGEAVQGFAKIRNIVRGYHI